MYSNIGDYVFYYRIDSLAKDKTLTSKTRMTKRFIHFQRYCDRKFICFVSLSKACKSFPATHVQIQEGSKSFKVSVS